MKGWATHSSLSFQAFPAFQEAKVENVGRMYAYQEAE